MAIGKDPDYGDVEGKANLESLKHISSTASTSPLTNRLPCYPSNRILAPHDRRSRPRTRSSHVPLVHILLVTVYPTVIQLRCTEAITFITSQPATVGAGGPSWHLLGNSCS